MKRRFVPVRWEIVAAVTVALGLSVAPLVAQAQKKGSAPTTVERPAAPAPAVQRPPM